MIELLVKYIEDKGFQVNVLPNILLIKKEAKGQICQVDWMLSKHDLQPEWKEYLYNVATGYMEQIDKAIAEREVASDTGMDQAPGMG